MDPAQRTITSSSAPNSTTTPHTPVEIAELLTTNYPALRLLLIKSTRNESVAQDLLNDAIAVALEHLREGRIARPEEIAGYVYQVALNLLRNHRRKMDERTDRRADPETLETIAGESKDPLAAEQIANQVRELILDLPTDRDRQIVKRFYLDEADKDLICRELELSPLHFDKVIFRARQRMKSMLQKRGLKRTDFFSILWAA